MPFNILEGNKVPIKVGDKIPDTVPYLRELSFEEAKPEDKGKIVCGLPVRIQVSSVFDNKKVVLFGVPGAFTPTCSLRHLPGFLENIEIFKAKGIEVACVAVNDPFVLSAWAQELKVDNKIRMLSDGSGEFAKALGLAVDLTSKGMGLRNLRFALYADNRVVKYIGIDYQGLEESSVETILKKI